MTIIFREGRGFVPSTIFVPQFIDYHPDIQSDFHAVSHKVQTQNTDFLPPETSSTLRDVAAIAFQKLFKNDDDISHSYIGNDTDIFRMTFDQLAEKRQKNTAENDYNNFIAKREEKIRSEQKRLLDIEEYNRDFNEKLSESKQRAADKKRQDAERIGFLRGLLMGDDYDPSIPKPMLCVLQAVHAEFFKIWALKTYRVDAIQKISPVVFDYGGGYYRPLRDVSVKCHVKPRKQMVFWGKYRSWCNQFVRKIIEKRQRGPPANRLLKPITF